MRDLSKTVKVPLCLWLKASALIKKKSLQFNLHSLTVHFTSQGILLSQRKSCLRCLSMTLPLNRVNYLQSISFGKYFPAATYPVLSYFVSAYYWFVEDQLRLNQQTTLTTVDKPCPTIICKLPYPCLPSMLSLSMFYCLKKHLYL